MQPAADTASPPTTATDGKAKPVTYDPKTHWKTDGEKEFDLKTYKKIGYYWNVGISLGAVLWADRTKAGQALIKGLGEGFANIGVSRKWAEYLGTKSFFLAGGFAVMPPMKWQEDTKPQQVHENNLRIYGERATIDPDIIQSEAEVAAAPKQSWKSILGARGLALVPFYVGYGLLWGPDSKLAKATGGKVFIDRPIAWASREIGLLGSKLLGHAEAHAQIEELKRTAPGIMRSMREFTARPGHDPMHSTGPYYVISEFITSGMVAWGVYALTRVLGPMFGKAQPQPPVHAGRPATAHADRAEEPLPDTGKAHDQQAKPSPVVNRVELAQEQSRLAETIAASVAAV